MVDGTVYTDHYSQLGNINPGQLILPHLLLHNPFLPFFTLKIKGHIILDSALNTN